MPPVSVGVTGEGGRGREATSITGWYDRAGVTGEAGRETLLSDWPPRVVWSWQGRRGKDIAGRYDRGSLAG